MSAKKETAPLLMPKATAVWLVQNTGLKFEQVAQFTGLHAIEVQALADEEVGRGIVGRNPIDNNELTQDELDKAAEDPTYEMKRSSSNLPPVKARSKGPKYTPVSKRGDKPDAIAYLLKNHQEISEAQITKLIGTTKLTIERVRSRTHPNSPNIKPRHPVDLGLCTYAELEAASNKGFKAQGKDPEEMKRQKEEAAQKEQNAANPFDDTSSSDKNDMNGFDFSNFINSGSSGNSSN